MRVNHVPVENGRINKSKSFEYSFIRHCR